VLVGGILQKNRDETIGSLLMKCSDSYLDGTKNEVIVATNHVFCRKRVHDPYHVRIL
jgi:hypothetical protein